MASLALTFEEEEDNEDDSVQEDIKEIEEEIMKELKPQLRMLSLYERYINVESDNAYTTTIGIVERAKDLPNEYDSIMKKALFASKSVGNIYLDDELRQAHDDIEQQALNLLSNIVTDGMSQKAEELDKDTLRSFLKSYEKMRESEKRMIAEGYDEKHFTKGRMYARLLKNFAKQSDPT